MIHKFKRHTRSYLVLSKDCLEDKAISWRAKGLHSYLISLPEDWNINLTDLIERSTDGRVSTENAVNELISKGYMTRVQFRENGRLAKVHYEAFESSTQNTIWNPVENTPEERRNTTRSSAANGESTTTKDTLDTKESEDNKNTTMSPDSKDSEKPSQEPIPNSKASSESGKEDIVPVPTVTKCPTTDYNTMFYGLWSKKMLGSKPRKGDMPLIKELCEEHGVPTVRKVLEHHFRKTDAAYISISRFSSMFGVHLQEAGGPVLTPQQEEARKAAYFRKPTVSMD
ncbi:MAG: hypothetical protein WCY09_08435 [Candidatus Omnitrophota bacterium]